ncbi:hypothetical protein L208DRAFT_159034 [Tricholoma matsutake]|nr:hypothetical protein L208DRAFT_159034 [Tricholoma matsutake 945]
MSSPKITMPGKAVVVNQPNPGVEMDAMKANKTSSCQHEESHKAHRIRGGGAAKDCFLGMLGCFLCFECCEGCCGCVADIICCPCEMCC